MCYDFYGWKKSKCWGVYIHKNLTNNKIYVGQSKNVYYRIWLETKGRADNKGCKKMHKDYEKGDKFEVAIIYWNAEYPNLNEAERIYIRIFQSTKNGYNETFGNFNNGDTIYKKQKH